MFFLRPKLLRQLGARTMGFYYAVSKGRKIGIYESWAQCEEQVKGFRGALYKKFRTREEAEEFIGPGAAGCSRNFVPTNVAVALGRKEPPPASWHTKQNKQPATEATDFWPDDVEDDFELSDIKEDDLISVMNEVEGFPLKSDSRKRKVDGTGNYNTKIPRYNSTVLEATGLKRIGAFEFEIDAEGYVIVYTDGSCLRNGQSNAAAGFGVYFGEKHELNAAKPVLGRVTNNVGEIQAAIYAIKTARDLGIHKLCISTDSQFLINSITLWVKGWKRHNWRLKNNEPVKNIADFKELDELLQKGDIQVKWNYVEAHKGIKGNEIADKLARQGSELYRKLNSA
ncbi:ribonuclease H1 [Scaptodrosophila lebanonensis]|uniref:Ribonuclease H1 n=1 Tax=Drosophila lebanonensis TaxID=7225 RepID=A0A6J2UFS7_DROLE|nr:ribonuclease H1 [Scaptodrosophila lebanonensis]